MIAGIDNIVCAGCLCKSCLLNGMCVLCILCLSGSHKHVAAGRTIAAVHMSLTQCMHAQAFGVKDPADYTHHGCPTGKHSWPPRPRSQWSLTCDGPCPCGHLRFKEVDLPGGKKILEPTGIVRSAPPPCMQICVCQCIQLAFCTTQHACNGVLAFLR
jgi:hypothetical protein